MLDTYSRHVEGRIKELHERMFKSKLDRAKKRKYWNGRFEEKMSIIKRMIYVVVGTVLVVLGALGIFGAIGLSNEYSSQPFFLLGQFILPIALFILGIYLLAQFYKKPDNKDEVKWLTKKKEKIRQRRYIEKGTKLEPKDKDSKTQGKRHIKKPKMPARIKKTPRGRQK